jgi:hypothetical protein
MEEIMALGEPIGGGRWGLSEILISFYQTTHCHIL